MEDEIYVRRVANAVGANGGVPVVGVAAKGVRKLIHVNWGVLRNPRSSLKGGTNEGKVG